MKYGIIGFVTILLCACASQPSSTIVNKDTNQNCIGSVYLPESLASLFDPVNDPDLLEESIGLPEEGKLCQGRVYQTKANAQIIIYRAWNSTNPNSQFGQWWAFQQPSGRVSQYRSDYEICYQWSPLDKLVRCTLKPGSKVVIGTGQSAKCSDYLSYPISRRQQIFLDNATDSVMNCRNYDGEFSWK